MRWTQIGGGGGTCVADPLPPISPWRSARRIRAKRGVGSWAIAEGGGECRLRRGSALHETAKESHVADTTVEDEGPRAPAMSTGRAWANNTHLREGFMQGDGSATVRRWRWRSKMPREANGMTSCWQRVAWQMAFKRGHGRIMTWPARRMATSFDNPSVSMLLAPRQSSKKQDPTIKRTQRARHHSVLVCARFIETRRSMHSRHALAAALRFPVACQASRSDPTSGGRCGSSSCRTRRRPSLRTPQSITTTREAKDRYASGPTSGSSSRPPRATSRTPGRGFATPARRRE